MGHPVEDNTLVVDDFVADTIGIIVFFVGMHVNRRVTVLRSFNIPEPVTGGILASVTVLFVFEYT